MPGDNTLTSSGAISACGKAQQPHEAMEFLAEGRRRLAPKAITDSTTVSAGE